MKRFLQAAGIAAVLGAILAVAALFALPVLVESSAVQERLRSLIDDAIPGRIDWRDLRLSLPARRLTVVEPALVHADGRTVAAAKEVALAVALLPLVRGEVRIPMLRVVAPSLRLSETDGGGLDLAEVFADPDAPAPPEGDGGVPPWPVTIRVDAVRIDDADLEYRAPDARWQMAGERIALSGEARPAGPSGRLDVELEGVRIDGPGLSVPSVAATARLALVDGRLEPLRCSLALPASRLELTGRVDDIFDAPGADLNVEVSVDLPELGRVFRLEAPMTGTLDGRLDLQGGLARPDASLRLEYHGGELGDLRVDGGALEARLRDGRVELKRLGAEVGDGGVLLSGTAHIDPMFPNGLLAAPVVADALRFDLDTTVSALDLGRLWAGATPAGGTVSGRATLAGTGVTPSGFRGRLDLDADARDLVVGDAPPIASARLRAGADVLPERIELTSLDATADSLHLSGNGRLERPGLGIEAHAELEAPDLGAVLSALNLPASGGSVRLRADVEGALSRPLFDADLEARGLTYDSYSLGDLRFAARLARDGVLRVTQLAVANGNSTLTGSGTAALFTQDGRFDPEGRLEASLRIENLEPGRFDPRLPVEGRFSGTANVGGRVLRPEASAAIRGGGVSVSGFRVGDLEADVRFDQGRLEARRIDLRRGRSRVRATGAISLLDPEGFTPVADPAVDLRIPSARLYLEEVTDRAAGPVSLTAEIGGTLSRPAGTAALRGSGLRLDRQPVSDLVLDARLAGDRVVVDALRLDLSPGQRISADGWIDRSGAYRVTAGTRRLRLESLAAVSDLERLRGLLTASVEGAGTLEAPNLSGTVSLTDLRFDDQPLADAAFAATLDPKRLSIRGRPGFDVDAEMDWRRKDFSAAATFSDTPLAPYFALGGRPDLSGRLTGRVRATGNLDRPARTEGSLDISSLSVQYRDTPLLSTRGLTARVTGGRIDVPEATLLFADEGRLTVSGQGRLDGDFRAAVEGDIPLGVAGHFTDALPDLTGRALLDADLAGPLSAPRFDAVVRLEAAAFTIPDLLQRVHDVHGEIRATPEAVTLTGVRGRLDDGTFGLGGTVSLEALRPAGFDLSFEARRLPFGVPETLDIRLDADLFLQGGPEAPRLSGAVAVVDGLYYRDFKVRLVDTVDRMRKPPPPKPPAGMPPVVARTALDVTVTAREPFVVDNNVALLAVEPDLRITGTAAQPVVSGRTEVPSGIIRYNRQEFTLTRGIVDFVNPYRIEPELDLSAESEIREWTIVLDVTGTPDNLRFRLSSTPPENDEDILSLLAFGKTTRELVADERGSPSGMPRELLASLVAGKLVEDFKETTGIDRLEVEYDAAEEPEGRDEVKVTVGKELSRRLSILYDVETRQGEAVQQVTTEYKLLERLVVSAFQDSVGDFGGNVQFRLEFR